MGAELSGKLNVAAPCCNVTGGETLPEKPNTERMAILEDDGNDTVTKETAVGENEDANNEDDASAKPADSEDDVKTDDESYVSLFLFFLSIFFVCLFGKTCFLFFFFGLICKCVFTLLTHTISKQLKH